MKPEEIKKLCGLYRDQINARESASDPAINAEVMRALLALLEVHLVNQARIADTLHSLLIHVRQHQGG